MNEIRVKQLRQNGWSLKFELISDEKQLLDIDLRTFGEKSLPDQPKLDRLGKSFVVQLHKTRNVTAPKENEHSTSRAPLFRLTITDGQTFQNALILPSVKHFSLDTPPGVKLLIKENTQIQGGFYILNDQCCQILGGNVEELVQKWKLSKLMGKYVRTMTGEGAPPPWVQFGTRVKSAQTVDTSQRSMDVAKVQQSTEEDPEFVRSRRAAIDTLLTGEANKVERFSRQNLNCSVNLTKNSEQSSKRPVVEKAPPVQQKVENPQPNLSTARLPDWAKNQIADGPDEEEKRRDFGRFGRNRRNKNDENEETRPNKDVTLFDFIDKKPQGNKNSATNKNDKKKIFPYAEGDQVLVRYAQDNEYYPAVILRILNDKQKSVVMFEGFDNEEFVDFTDVEPYEEGYYEEDPSGYYQQYPMAAAQPVYHQQNYNYSNQPRQNSARRYH